jgi:regulator of nucleoside diphosphate kinase
MKEEKLLVTIYDLNRLRVLIDSARKIGLGEREVLGKLEKDLKKARVCLPEFVPQNRVTMNSLVKLRFLPGDMEVVYTIVFPQDADIEDKKLSILTPVGSSLIGRRAGDVIKCAVPDGLRKLEVVDVLYQPEAAGVYTL